MLGEGLSQPFLRDLSLLFLAKESVYLPSEEHRPRSSGDGSINSRIPKPIGKGICVPAVAGDVSARFSPYPALRRQSAPPHLCGRAAVSHSPAMNRQLGVAPRRRWRVRERGRRRRRRSQAASESEAAVEERMVDRLSQE